MIHELAMLSIRPGREAAFEAAFERVPDVFARATGCHGVELERCVEDPSRYALRVAWATVEDHTVGFRGSPLFGEWRSHVGEFFAEPPAVQHYEPIGS